MNLAKAIHGANTAAPELPVIPKEDEQLSTEEEWRNENYQVWRRNRRAVIQTLDSSAVNSKHAQKVVRNFRRGIYFPHVDFHVGSIHNYITDRLRATSGTPFLDHAILDLPATEDYIEIVGKALRPNGSLITFCPHITQINKMVLFAKEEDIPLYLEKVVEVGGAVGVGGREWDVRPVKPRALLKAESVSEPVELPPQADEEIGGNEKTADHEIKAEESEAEAEAEPETPKVSGWEMVCRPKVGLRISGGGFVGVWRRMVEKHGR